MGQILSGRAHTHGLDACLTGIVAAIGAEAVLSHLRRLADSVELGENVLHESIVLVKQPAGEEALTLNRIAGIALLLTHGKGNLGLDGGVLGHQVIQQCLDRCQHAFLRLPHQQPPVIGGAAVGGNHRGTGIGCRLDIRQLQNALAQNRMLHRLQAANGLHHLAHAVYRIDTLFRVCRVGGHAKGLDHDFGTASLADLQIAQGCLADNHIVGLDDLADATGGHALKALLVYNAGNINLAGKVTGGILCKEIGGGGKGSHCALHI